MEEKLPKLAQEAKNQGYPVYFLEEDGGLGFYMRLPSKAELMLFQDNAARGGGSLSAAQEKFVRTLFVGDNAEAFDACLNQKPLAAGKIFDRLAEDLGLNINFTKTQV